jgi:hypothetical protein
MVLIETKGGDVIISVLGWHVLWAFKRVICLKRERIQSIKMADTNLRPPWLRCPGTYLPGFICAGTYHGKGRKEFWDTTFTCNSIKTFEWPEGNAVWIDLPALPNFNWIGLKGKPYTRIVVDVENPDSVIRALTPI